MWAIPLLGPTAIWAFLRSQEHADIFDTRAYPESTKKGVAVEVQNAIHDSFGDGGGGGGEGGGGGTEFQFHSSGVDCCALSWLPNPQIEQSASSVAGGFPPRLALRRLFTCNVRRL